MHHEIFAVSNCFSDMSKSETHAGPDVHITNSLVILAKGQAISHLKLQNFY